METNIQTYFKKLLGRKLDLPDCSVYNNDEYVRACAVAYLFGNVGFAYENEYRFYRSDGRIVSEQVFNEIIDKNNKVEDIKFSEHFNSFVADLKSANKGLNHSFETTIVDAVNYHFYHAVYLKSASKEYFYKLFRKDSCYDNYENGKKYWENYEKIKQQRYSNSQVEKE